MLNLRSNRTPWSNFPEGDPSSHKVTHPHTTPAQARLTSEFYPNPSNSSLHRHLLIYLAYQSYYTLLMSRTLFMFMTMMKFWKIFQTSRSYYVSFFEKKFKKINFKTFFLNFFASRSWKPRNFFCVRFLGSPPLNSDVTFWVDDFSYIKLFNPSSYAKVMPILQMSREILQIKSKFIFVNFLDS